MKFKFARDIANAVAFLHAHNITHRDLKPANVMVLHGVCKLSDFGLSRIVDIRGMSGAVGTVSVKKKKPANPQKPQIPVLIIFVGLSLNSTLRLKCFNRRSNTQENAMFTHLELFAGN
jgi:serine/threonine protein kinase